MKRTYVKYPSAALILSVAAWGYYRRPATYWAHAHDETHPAAVPAAMLALTDGQACVRKTAAAVLCNLRPSTPHAAAALTQALEDPDESVRSEAALALMRIAD